jgi:hypothetical protein
MQLVCYVTSIEGVTYSVTGSVNRVNSYTAEAGATKGATVGVNLLDSAAGVLYGTDILNKYSNAAQLAGDLSGNPFLVRVDAEYDRPANVKAVWGSSVKAGLGFTDENRNCLKMYGSATRSAGWPAIKVQAGMKYAANLRWRVLNAASQTAGVFFVFLYTTGDLAPGCTHIGISGATDETGVDPSGIWNGPAGSTVSDTLTPTWSGVYHDRPSSPSWQMTTVEFKPPADAKWCSFIALGWDQYLKRNCKKL